MKKINKYFNTAETPSLAEGLSLYKKMARSIQKDKSNAKVRRSSPLSLIIPFAAASLSPFAAQASCDGTFAGGAGDGNDFNIDVDGDNTPDFFISNQANDLFITPLGGNEVIAPAAAPGFFYAANLNAGDAISSGNANWRNGVATLEYGGTAGNWAPSGSGYLGVRINGDQLGFIQISWDGINVTFGDIGVQGGATGPSTASTNASDCDALPVELTNFNGRMFDAYAELKWTTNSEENNKGFKVQRSTNGEIFQTIGFIEGQGNSFTNIDYSFKDENVKRGKDYYYRLEQIDHWGSKSLSEMINLKALESTRAILTISPNPASNRLNVAYQSAGNTPAELSVFDMRGQQIINQVLEADAKSSISLNIEQLPAGSYFLKVEEAGEVEYRKFIKS